MSWIGIDWSNPLILLRVFLTIIWLAPALYAAKCLWVFPKRSPVRPLLWLTLVASLLGSLSYFIGAATSFTSPGWFIWVASLLTFTPLSLIAWMVTAEYAEKSAAGSLTTLSKITQRSKMRGDTL
jgi:hypothetical protein